MLFVNSIKRNKSLKLRKRQSKTTQFHFFFLGGAENVTGAGATVAGLLTPSIISAFASRFL
jgi:hypothetical protein